MGLWDRLVGQRTAELIEWIEPAEHATLAVRQMGVRLKEGDAVLVRKGQACVINSGDVADVLGPGRHHLSGPALPKLTAAKVARWPGAAFRADVTFVSLLPHAGVPWATAAAVVARGANRGAIPAKATGEIGFVVCDPAAFVREVVAQGDTAGTTRTEVAGLVTSYFADVFRTGRLEGAELLGPTGRLGLLAGEQLAQSLRAVGLALLRFVVKNVTVAPEARRPHVAVAESAADGYHGDMPSPLFPDVPVPAHAEPVAAAPPPVQAAKPPQTVHRVAGQSAPVAPPGLPALPPGLADILELPRPHSSGPKSVRLPLADDAPEGIFDSRRVSTGPQSERLLIGHTGDADHGLGPVTLTDHAPQSGRFPKGAAAVPMPPVQPPGPPPLPAAPEFHVSINGTPVGPLDLAALSGRVLDGSLGRKSLVWRPGMAAWLPAEQVAELAPLFAPPQPPTELPPELPPDLPPS
jgi:hypothetical protein